MTKDYARNCFRIRHVFGVCFVVQNFALIRARHIGLKARGGGGGKDSIQLDVLNLSTMESIRPRRP